MYNETGGLVNNTVRVLMDANIIVMLFIALGGITMCLPLLFVKPEVMSIRNIFLILALFLGFSVMFSGVVAVGGKCGFLETMLMQGSQCNYLPFANTRTVPVTNAVAFVFFVLLLIASFRDFVLKIRKSRNNEAL